MYSLLCRHANIGILPSRRAGPNSSLSHANYSMGIEKQSRLGKFFERSITSRRMLLFIAMLGMCMLIGDGILTPAISGFNSALNYYSTKVDFSIFFYVLKICLYI